MLVSNSQVMLDVETLSTKPNGALISIGAVKFCLSEGVQDVFTVNIDPRDCKKRGLRIDKETVEWWSNQSKDAISACASNPQPLDIALQMFSDWYGPRSRPSWSKGAYFDFPILDNAFAVCGMKSPWKYWHVQDYRTVCNVLKIDDRQLKSADSTWHDPVSDCKEQLKILLPILQSLEVAA